MIEHLTDISGTSNFNFLIPEHLENNCHDAIDRLRYLHPEISFELKGNNLICRAPETVETDAVLQEVYYSLYRSKIRAEGAAHRNALFATVFGR